jgi:hypothetical protein
MKTKKHKVLEHLHRFKSITSWQAITKYRATRLSAIIFRLKEEGINIKTEMVYKKGDCYAVYKLC